MPGPTADLLPGALNVKFKRGNGHTLLLTWPAGVLDGRTFTAELDTAPVSDLDVDVTDDEMVITLTHEQSALVTGATWGRLLEGDQELIAIKFLPRTGGTSTPTTTAVTVTLTEAQVTVSANAPGDPLGTAQDLVDGILDGFTATGPILVPDVAYDATTWNGSAAVPTRNAVRDVIELLARIASPTFTGTPAAPTAAPGTNTTQLATTAFVAAAVAALIDSSPGTLDTLNELAAALGDDPNFATTVTNALAGKIAASTLTTDGDLLTRAAGVVARITRASLAGDSAFSSIYKAKANDAHYLDHGAWIPQANVTNPTDHIGTGGSGSMGGWVLNASSTLRHLVTSFVPPADWAEMAIDLYWLNNGAGSGNVRWRVDVNGTTLGTTTSGTVSTTQQTIAALAQNAPKAEVGFSTGVVLDPLKFHRISVIRHADNVVDTLANAVFFLGLGLRRTA